MPLDREADVLPETVRDKIEVAGTGSHPLGLCPLDVVLEPVEAAPDASGPGEPDEVLGRLDEYRHLVAVVLTAVVEPVDGRSHGRAEDRAALDDFLRVHLSSPFSVTF